MTTIKKTLNQADINFLIEEMKQHFVTKEELQEAISHLPNKDEFFAKMDEILAAVNKKDEEDLVHKSLHTNNGGDIADLQQKVNHLYKIFEVDPPVSPAY